MGHRILVVAGTNELLQALPGQLGAEIEVRLIDSANDALWELRDDPPAAIVADIDLPGMSGLEMAEIIPNFDIPTRVVLWSRAADENARQQAETYGVYRFLSGAVTAHDLHSALQEAIHAEPVAAPATPEPEPALEPEPAPEREPAPAAAAPEPARQSAGTRLRSGGRSDRLAARTRAAAERPPAPATTAAEPVFTPSRRHDGNLVITADNLTPIRNIMGQLSQDLGAQCVMLTDRAGMVLVEFGSTDGLPMMILLPLLSTSFSTAGEVSRQLREEDATTLYIHEGASYDLYCFDVLHRFLLVLVFNKKVASSKIGAVWVNAKRAIRELRETMA